MLVLNTHPFWVAFARRLLVSGAVGGLVACGGGGGGSPAPAPKNDSAAPLFVDAADYTGLVFQPATTLLTRGYGHVLDEAYLPGTSVWSDAGVVSGISMAAVESVGADVRFLPAALRLSMSLDGLPFTVGGSDATYGPLTIDLVAGSHPVAYTTLRRFRSGVMPNGVNICASLLDASALGIQYAKPLYWRYRNDAAAGYLGTPTVRGAHVMGVHTSGIAVDRQASSTYAGVFIGTIAAPTETVTYAFDEVSARLQVSLDAASRTVTFVPQGTMAYQQNDCLIGGLSARGSMDTLNMPWDSLVCHGALDPATRAVRCVAQSPDGSMTAEYRGQFFGPGAREFAGTVYFRGALGGGSVANASITGAFVTTRQPLVP